MAHDSKKLDDQLDEVLVKDEDGKFKILSKKSTVAANASVQEKSTTGSNASTASGSTSPHAAPASAVAHTQTPTVIEQIQKDIKDALARKYPAPVGPVKLPQSLGAKPDATTNYDKMFDEIIARSGVIIKDQVLLGRLKSIIVTQLRGVRKIMDIRLILIRPPQQGGMGLDGVRADKIIEALNKNQDNAKPASIKQIMDEKSAADLNRVKRTLSPAPDTISRTTASELKLISPQAKVMPHQAQALPAQTPKSSDMPPSPPLAQPKTSFPVTFDLPPGKKPEPPGKKSEPSVIKPAPPAVRPAPSEKIATEIPVRDLSAKPPGPGEPPKITDIRMPTQLIGPVQELKFPIIDFRRLAPPKNIGTKILEKVRLLEAESFTKKMEGIKSWQSSEVFQTYLQMGLESVKDNISLEEVIKKKQVAGLAALTKEEFLAVNSINSSLQF